MRIYNAIQNILIGIAVLIIAVVGVLWIFNIHPKIVLSGSMEPTIKTGSVCFIDYGQKTPEKGDIIAFTKGTTDVTHRVVEVREDGYVTKGDNNDSNDPGIVYKSQVYGTNVFWIPNVGYWIMALKTAKGIGILATAVVAFIILGALLRNMSGKKDE